MNKSTASLASNNKGKWKDYFTSYLFALPALLFLFVFIFVPILYVGYLSFHKYQLPGEPIFIGLENYTRVLQDEVFLKSIFNTIVYTISSVTLAVLLALVVAYLLNRMFKGKKFYKVFYFLPTVTSEVIIAMIFFWMFDHNLGVINYTLTALGIPDPPAWLLDPFWAMVILIMVGTWRGVSYNIPILLSALESVPRSLYEAADLDGATDFHKFFKISIPSVKPMILYSVVMGIIGSFQVVAIVDVLTDGGPKNSTLVSLKYIWQQAFEFNYIGYGATLSLALLPILIIGTGLAFKISARGD
ncbi:Lactose transport system permease protein LacF [Paraliobacillus sp. PM-2]|uniref:carbohydrate ABC transporter permease n=1 Tax=Paraliobacillus sp. PM-2 TaxID=1462524 RepID=UPI00061C112F|nr:sugar ABC transporter permease [Paraliobacillus sp. PM-2]CQR46458.1 Lactose transport system permease protein LacF [Paraliobacillus sp. PM-2]